MKTIFTLLVSSLITVSAFAAEVKSTGSITIRTADNSNLRVVLDGKKFEPNNSTFFISGINEGYHSVKVYRQVNNGYYNMKSARFDMVYSGSLDLKRKTSLEVTIGRNNQVSMKETRISGQGRPSNGGYEYGDKEDWGGYDQNEAYASGMNSREFDRLLVTLDKEWLESNKIKSAVQIVRSNALTSSQVSELVRLFTFENNKLDLAKQAYQNTVDKRNYYLVSDLLTFSNSKAELDRFIRKGR